VQSPPWSTNVRFLAFIIILIGFIALVIFAFPLVEALMIAALLAFLLDPLVRCLMRKFHLKRAWAAMIIYFIVIVVLASIPALLGTLAFTQLNRLGENFQEVLIEMQKWISRPIVLFGFDLSPRNLVVQFGQLAGSALSGVTGNTLSLLSGITTNFLWVLLVLVSLYYLLKDGGKIKPWVVGLAAPAYRDDIQKLMDELDRVWSLFMRVQLLIFVVLAILLLIGTSLVVWLYQLGWIPFSTLGLIAMLILVYALVQQVDNLWLRPQMLGSQLRLHPGVVFVGLIGALAIGGVLAAIVIVPVMASVKVLGRYVRCKLLGLPPWEEETRGEQDLSQG
jgi:predicted PurR-regulated permease PerM